MTFRDPATVLAAYEAHISPGWARLLRVMGLEGVEWRAEGCLVYDSEGRDYLDCLGGYGVFSYGHRHPKVVAAFLEQFQRQPLSSRLLMSGPYAELASRLAEITPGDLQYAFVCHSGAEAVEGALKLARMATGKTEIIATEGAFHGKTFGALSASGRAIFRKPVEPLVPGFVHVPYGDVDAAAAAITERTAAIIVEPIQGENGVIVPPSGYLRGLRELCDRHGLLLILDEVQTGFGRTGKLFAAEHEGVAPDIMTLSKALGGGVSPLGAFVGNERAWAPLIENPYLHTTSVLNLAGCAAACAAIDVLLEEKLPERAAEAGARLINGLVALRERYGDVLAEVRGRGLMIGLSFAQEGQAAAVMGELLNRRVLAAFTWNNPNVIRLEPPLTITDDQIDRLLTDLEASLETVRQMWA